MSRELKYNAYFMTHRLSKMPVLFVICTSLLSQVLSAGEATPPVSLKQKRCEWVLEDFEIAANKSNAHALIADAFTPTILSARVVLGSPTEELNSIGDLQEWLMIYDRKTQRNLGAVLVMKKKVPDVFDLSVSVDPSENPYGFETLYVTLGYIFKKYPQVNALTFTAAKKADPAAEMYQRIGFVKRESSSFVLEMTRKKFTEVVVPEFKRVLEIVKRSTPPNP